MVAVAVLLGVLLVLPASAGADHPGGETFYTQESPSGAEGTVATHGDPVPPDADNPVQNAIPAVEPGSIAQRILPNAACSVVANTADNTANSPYPSSAATVKVIYAYRSDQPNEFASDGPVLQAGARAMADFVQSESGGLTVRFDLGTTQGATCLDIQTIPLPHDFDYYYINSGIPHFTAIKQDVQGLLGPQPSPRNYLVYVDNHSQINYGEAERWNTESPTPGSLHNQGNLFAVMYGQDGTDFFFSNAVFPAGTTSRDHLEFALHEVTHTLGAVGPNAPHTSGAGHCNDEYDVLCYDDVGGGSPFVSSSCDGLNPPVDPYGSTFQAWDCSKDDYFSASPPAGSYLGVNWNIANSDFLVCEVASCPRPGVRPLPSSGPVAGTSTAPPPLAGKKKCRKGKKNAAAAKKRCKKKN